MATPAPVTEPAVNYPGSVEVAINVLTSPTQAFRVIKDHPRKLFPLLLVLLSSAAVTAWYFSVLDFDWYIDDTLSRFSELSEEQMQSARERMESISQGNTMLLGIAGSSFSLLIIYVVQSAYLALVSALNGDRFRFSHWFSLICWTNLPYLLVVISMAVNIILNPDGQISVYDLNSLSFTSLGFQSGNGSLDQMLGTLNLSMFWSLALVIMGYRQWLQASTLKSTLVVSAPYLVIFGLWAYLALT